MGTFNAGAFRDKLGSLNSTQASIETLSNWCQFFRKSVRALQQLLLLPRLRSQCLGTPQHKDDSCDRCV